MTPQQLLGQSQRFTLKMIQAELNKSTKRIHRAKLPVLGGADMFRRYWGKWDRAEKRAWRQWCKTRDAAFKWGLIQQTRPN